MADCVVSSLPGNSINGEISGTFRPGGLTIGGKISLVTINSTTWTPLPATPLAQRNALVIQNVSGTEIKIQYDNTVVGYIGVTVMSGNERSYSITDQIIIYAKALSGTPTIQTEEIA
jgi:hypothetical protein